MLLLVAGHGLLPAPLLAHPPVPATSRLSVLMSGAPPVTELLLQSKRPIGRRQLGYKATRWLKREMEACADEYLRGIAVADPMRPQEILTARALAMSFAPEALEERLNDRLFTCLTEDCDPEQSGASVFVGDLAGDKPLFFQLGEGDRAAHEVAASHKPTVWAAFQLAVQTKLQKQNGSAQVGDELAWKDTAAWRVFLHLQRDVQSKQSKPKPSKSAKGARARKGGKQQKQKPTAAPLTLDTPLTVVKADSVDSAAGEASKQGEATDAPWRGGATLEKRGALGRVAASKARDQSRILSARAKDAARRASLVRSAKLPYGKRELGQAMNIWLMGGSTGCADAYCVAVEAVRDAQVSELIDLLGCGDAGTSAVITALNTEVVSAEAVERAAGLLVDAEQAPGAADLALDVEEEAMEEEGAAAEGKASRAEAAEKAAAVEAAASSRGSSGGRGGSSTGGSGISGGIGGGSGGGGALGSSVGDEFGKLHYERMLTELRPRFGVVATARRFNEVLDRCGPPPPLGELAPPELDVRNHVPTLWSYFTRAVRKRLEAQLGRERWSESAEWRVLQALYAEAAASKATPWQLSRATRRAPHQRLVGRWQRGPADAHERKQRSGKKLRPVGTWAPEGGRGGRGGGGGTDAEGKGQTEEGQPALAGKVTPRSRARGHKKASESADGPYAGDDRVTAPRAEGLPQRA